MSETGAAFWRGPFARAAALLVLPLAAGGAWFNLSAEPQTPGVYVEIEDGTYRLPDCGWPSDAATATPVVRGHLLAFYAVARQSEDAPPPPARIFLRAINYSEPDVEYPSVAVDTQVRRMHREVVRIAPVEPIRWDPQGLPNSVLRQALSQIAVRRSTTELIAEVDLGDGSACRYGVALGPPSVMPWRALGWFVPPPGAQR